MDAFETSLVAGDAPGGPPEDKNEAEENGIAGDSPDGPVDIREEGLDDRDSETSSAHAHDPTNAMSKMLTILLPAAPLKMRRSMIPPTTLVQVIL
jgi:hypothetical protein